LSLSQSEFRLRLLWIALIALFLPVGTASGSDASHAAALSSITAGELYGHVAVLADDSYEGRSRDAGIDAFFLETGPAQKDEVRAALAEPLTGAVERIGRKIGKMDVLSADPAAKTDARVVEVHIRLDDGAAASGLTNLQVEVELELEL